MACSTSRSNLGVCDFFGIVSKQLHKLGVFHMSRKVIDLLQVWCKIRSVEDGSVHSLAHRATGTLRTDLFGETAEGVM